ncbi:MAG TPA: 50S ribosomal protein L31, partial [Mycobacterium sp.]
KDSANTLDGRLITVTGFTFKADGRTDLARVVIICCAADATLARIRLSGPAAPQISNYPDLVVVDISASSHPFWTGSRRHIDTAGQVEKFRRRYGSRA